MRVTAVDRDESALAGMQGQQGIDVMLADLELGAWPIAGDAFDAIVVTNYLHRPLFAEFPGTLRPGGVLIYETFASGNERFGRPASPRFLLRPDELLNLSAPLQVIAFEQGIVHLPRPAVMQRICAVKAPDPGILDTQIPIP